MPEPTAMPKPKISAVPKAEPGQAAGAPREKRTDKMWRDAQANAEQSLTSFIAEPESMSVIAFMFVLLPTALLLDLLNLLDLSVVGAIVPYITDYTFGLALSFGLYLAGNKDPMQIAIAAVALLINIFPALRDFFPWTIAICAGFVISLPFVQRAMGRTVEFVGEATGKAERVKETVRAVEQAAKTAADITSKMRRA